VVKSEEENVKKNINETLCDGFGLENAQGYDMIHFYFLPEKEIFSVASPSHIYIFHSHSTFQISLFPLSTFECHSENRKHFFYFFLPNAFLNTKKNSSFNKIVLCILKVKSFCCEQRFWRRKFTHLKNRFP
jgi:hypothetical protein